MIRRKRIFLDNSMVYFQRLSLMLISSLVAVTLSACGSDSSPDSTDQSKLDSSMLDANSATVVYRYSDSSVPPEFHRSFRITSDANTSRLTIDSYGDILDDASMATDFDALSLVLTRLEQSELPEKTGFEDNTCNGGTGAFIGLYHSSDLQTPVRSIDIYKCASADADQAMKDARAIIDPVLEPFDVATRINDTRQ